MAEIIRFPADIFRPDDILFTPNFRNTGGGVSLSGTQQVVGSASGIWEATIFASKIRNSRFVQIWELLELRSEGRLNTVIVPVCGRRKVRPLEPLITAQKTPPQKITHNDMALFDDASGYSQDTMPVIATAAMPAGARSGEFLFLVGATPLEPGHFFSIAERLYRITHAEKLANNHYRIAFWPRLREGVKAGDDINFSTPACKMRLKTDKEMAVEKSFHRFAEPDIELIEYL